MQNISQARKFKSELFIGGYAGVSQCCWSPVKRDSDEMNTDTTERGEG